MAEGTEVGTAYVSIVPSAAGFGATLERQITGQAGQAGTAAGQALGAGITGQAAGIAKGVAGIFAVVGAGRFLSGAVAEAEDAARVGRLTESVIKATGGAAGVTADQVERLATSLSKVAGVDDEVIQSAENVLLTFRSVGSQVFPEAIKAALDMSAALGTDLQGAVIQLGKALNDPVQGLTALRRVGVAFTEEQQDQIRALQRSGDLLGAQRIILAELNSEFGGAAAAGATATARLSVAFGNLQESLGTVLVPGVELAADTFTALVGAVDAAPGPLRAVGTAMLVAAGGITAASLAVGLLAPKMRVARAELEGLGVAGTRAATALSLISKAGLTLAGISIGINFADKVTGVKDLDAEVAKLAATTDQDLNRAFHDTNNELRGWDLWQAVGLSRRHDEYKTFTKVLDEGNLALAQRIIASEKDVDVRARLQTAYDKAVVATRQLNTDQALTAEIIGDTGGAFHTVTGQAGEFARQLEDLRGELETMVASDWSAEIASNFESALNPLQRFTFGGREDVAALKDQVAQAKTDLDEATADLARLQGTGTAAEIARIRGQVGDIDAAQSAVDRATRRLGETRQKLAEAQRSPLTAVEENLEANVAGLTRWLDNLIKLSRGGHESLAKHLAALGPEAADAVAEAVGVSPRRQDELERLFNQADEKINELASGAFQIDLELAGRPGATAADVFVQRYGETLKSKLPAALQAALDEAIAALIGAPERQAAIGAAALHATQEEREAARVAVAIGPAAPPAAPPASLLPPGPPVPAPTAGIVFEDGAIKVYPVTGAGPAEIANEVGDHLAWRLTPVVGISGGRNLP